MTPKEQIQALLDQLPDDCSFVEIQNHLNSYGGRRRWNHAARDTEDVARREILSPRGQAESEGARAYAAWQRIVSI